MGTWCLAASAASYFRARLVAPALPLVLGLLYGCASTAQVSAPAPATEPDCSFRAATSCWTLAPRFARARVEPADSQPGEILSPPAAVLASDADSARTTNFKKNIALLGFRSGGR